MYDIANEYVEKKLLNKRTSNDGKYEIFCYSKECFFGKDTWDEVTLTHRGVLYLNGVQVNKPFKKIFNLNEHESTQQEDMLWRMENEEYEVMDKSNGHLFIMTLIWDVNGKMDIVYSTKGSLPNPDNELLNKDIEIFKEKYEANVLKRFDVSLLNPRSVSMTFMFEAIVEHDKHTLYDKQIEQYGENTFVLLGCTNYFFLSNTIKEVESDYLNYFANLIGCPLIKFYNPKELPNIEEWFSHKNIEGYVIRFLSDDHRFKVKTDEYWALRLKKDLNKENLMRLFANNTRDAFLKKMPEEIGTQIHDAISSYMFYDWYHNQFVKVEEIPEKYIEWMQENTFMTPEEKKELFTDDAITYAQKCYVQKYIEQVEIYHIVDNKNLKKEFYEYFLNNQDEFELDVDALLYE